MKRAKLLVMALSLGVCTMFTACAGNASTGETAQEEAEATLVAAEAQEETQDTEDEETKGSYRTSIVFNNYYNLMEDQTFTTDRYVTDDLALAGGTYTETADGVEFTAEDGAKETFIRSGKYFYRVDSIFDSFDGDDSGKAIEFDKDGKTEQSFTKDLIVDENMHYTLNIAFKKNGTMHLSYSVKEDQNGGNIVDSYEYDGEYDVEGEVVNLHYNNIKHPLIVKNDKLYFYVLNKDQVFNCGCVDA